jgi:hypothetical protein
MRATGVRGPFARELEVPKESFARQVTLVKRFSDTAPWLTIV